MENKAPYPHCSSVKWHDYSQRTFDLALVEKKPVFLLISASWCHWCHVYENETLESEEIRTNLNKNFIPIFVDADKRRDIARTLLDNGWPTTVFFSHFGKKVSSFSGHMPSKHLQEKLDQILKEDVNAAGRTKLNMLEEEERKPNLPSESELVALTDEFERLARDAYDPIFGGFGYGAKFPYAITLEYMLQVFLERKDRDVLAIVLNSLDCMIKGIYDEVEGGFFRYATQRDWSAPHYEKMLNDNALITRLLASAYSITKNSTYKKALSGTLSYVLNNLYDSNDGCFYGSQDADEDYYKQNTLEKRIKFGKPYVDKTKYCDWNSIMISAVIRAYSALKNEMYFNAAKKSLEFLTKNMIGANGAFHYYDSHRGLGLLDGQLINNAYAINLFLDAFETTKEEDYLKSGINLLEFALERFYDPKNLGFIERRSESKELYRSGEEVSRNKVYGENALMSFLLARAYGFTNNKSYLARSKETTAMFIYKNAPSLDEMAYLAMASKIIVNSR